MESERLVILPQEADIINIDRETYLAAARGEISAFSNLRDDLHRLLSLGGSTVLHIHIKCRLSSSPEEPTNFVLKILHKMFAELVLCKKIKKRINDFENKSANFVNEILEMCPMLSTQQNHFGETPLHIAAKYGDINMMRLLIEFVKRSSSTSVHHHVDIESGFQGEKAKMLLRIKNKSGDTALHESMRLVYQNKDERFDQYKVAKILSEEDCEIMYDPNAAGETPLYLAIKAGFNGLVRKGLDCMEAQSESNCYDGPSGKTILHQAVIFKNDPIVEEILKERNVSSSVADSRMGDILQKRKELCRKGDEKGWVPLHYAANLGRKCAIEKLLKGDPLAASIRDKNGLIPLQVIADPRTSGSLIRKIISWSPDCCELLTVDDKCYWDESRSPAKGVEFKEEYKFALKIWRSIFYDEGRKTYKEKPVDKASTLVAAALIATVTFAAGFTLPGGTVQSGEDNAGSAALRGNSAFMAFIVTDAIAMALSSCAVLIHIFMALKRDGEKDQLYFTVAFILIIVSMVFMVTAFMSGISAVLGFVQINIISCFIISLFFTVCIIELTLGYFTIVAYPFVRRTALIVISLGVFFVLFSNSSGDIISWAFLIPLFIFIFVFRRRVSKWYKTKWYENKGERKLIFRD